MSWSTGQWMSIRKIIALIDKTAASQVLELLLARIFPIRYIDLAAPIRYIDVSAP
jgi:hypothetical protein